LIDRQFPQFLEARGPGGIALHLKGDTKAAGEGVKEIENLASVLGRLKKDAQGKQAS
jgi:hypothetical protein